jgi:hypothetical protein
MAEVCCASERIRRISGSHGGEYEAQNLLGCTAVMMEAARTSETSVDIQLRTRQYIPEDSELHFVEVPVSDTEQTPSIHPHWSRITLERSE